MVKKEEVVPKVPVEEVGVPLAVDASAEVGADVATEEVAETPAEEVAETPAEEIPTLKFVGQVVVRESTRIVEGREIHNLTLADGSSQDVSEEEYEAAVEASK